MTALAGSVRRCIILKPLNMDIGAAGTVDRHARLYLRCLDGDLAGCAIDLDCTVQRSAENLVRLNLTGDKIAE